MGKNNIFKADILDRIGKLRNNIIVPNERRLINTSDYKLLPQNSVSKVSPYFLPLKGEGMK